MQETRTSLKALFDAEEAANKALREAEERREKMMEQAFADAQEKAEIFRKEKEKELAAALAGTQNNFADLITQAEDAMRRNDQEFCRNKDKVADFLVERICRVDLQLHPNVAGVKDASLV